MKKEDLIKQCRYYSGEETCPFSDNEMPWFWDMERVYVSCNGNFTGEMEIYLTPDEAEQMKEMVRGASLPQRRTFYKLLE